MATEYIGASITFISAAFETAGYITQAKFLDIFTDFINTTGAFLYVLSCIFGIVFYAVFGKYEFVRYLVLGPVFFILALTWRVDSDGVAYQLGAGAKPRLADSTPVASKKIAAQNANGTVDETASSKADAVGGVTTSKSADESIKIAGLFEFYVRPINALVSELVGIILQQKDDKALLNMTRTMAMESLVSMRPKNPITIDILFNTYIPSCSDTLFSKKQQSDENHEEFKKAVETEKSIKNANISGEVRSKLTTIFIDDKESHNTNNEDYYKKVKEIEGVKDVKNTLFNCNELQSIALYFVFEDVYAQLNDWIVNKHAQVALGEDGKIKEENRKILCHELKEKLMMSMEEVKLADEKKATEECKIEDLGIIATIYFVRNAVQGHGTGIVSKILSRSAENDFYNPTSSNEGGSNNSEIRPARVGSMNANVAAGFRDIQRLRSEHYRKSIYGFLMNLPYWQGILLFLLASVYPFMCLMLVLPNRAMSFVTYILAWLWVKSWDIGLACVYLFSQVLWNILPQVSYPPALKNINKTDLTFEDIYKTAFDYDPSFSLHTYYMMLSMALFSVPALTGFVILKGKHSVLSSYANTAKDMADELGEMAGSSHLMSYQRHMNNLNAQGLAKPYTNLSRKLFPNYETLSKSGGADMVAENFLNTFGYDKWREDGKNKGKGQGDFIQELAARGVFGRDTQAGDLMNLFSNKKGGGVNTYYDALRTSTLSLRGKLDEIVRGGDKLYITDSGTGEKVMLSKYMKANGYGNNFDKMNIDELSNAYIASAASQTVAEKFVQKLSISGVIGDNALLGKMIDYTQKKMMLEVEQERVALRNSPLLQMRENRANQFGEGSEINLRGVYANRYGAVVEVVKADVMARKSLAMTTTDKVFGATTSKLAGISGPLLSYVGLKAMEDRAFNSNTFRQLGVGPSQIITNENGEISIDATYQNLFTDVTAPLDGMIHRWGWEVDGKSQYPLPNSSEPTETPQNEGKTTETDGIPLSMSDFPGLTLDEICELCGLTPDDFHVVAGGEYILKDPGRVPLPIRGSGRGGRSSNSLNTFDIQRRDEVSLAQIKGNKSRGGEV